MNIISDPAQRMLLWCVLDDALDVRLAPVLDCPACERWMEAGPCPRHQDGQETWAAYLDLSARLEASPAPAWMLRTGQVRLIAQALPEALAYRCQRPAAALDAALVAAYTALAGQLRRGYLQ